MQNPTPAPVAVPVPDDVFAAAFEKATRFAAYRAKKHPRAADAITDAVTDALLWAREHCTDVDTFASFAISAARRWIWRVVEKNAAKRARRPEVVELEPEWHEARAEGRVPPERRKGQKALRGF